MNIRMNTKPRMLISRYICQEKIFLKLKDLLFKRMNSRAKIIKGIVAATSLVNIPRMADPREQANKMTLFILKDDIRPRR